MKVILFGATGMIGAGVLIECLADRRVDEMLLISRTSAGISGAKVREVLHEDFRDLSAVASRFAGYDACFFCLGVTSVGLDEAQYSAVTYDLTLAAAKATLAASPAIVFCYVSAGGADPSGKVMWTRVKGRVENALLEMPFKAAYMTRPLLIFPKKGVKSKTRWYQAFYDVFGFAAPVFLALFNRWVTTTELHGKAMINLAAFGYEKRILECDDINRLARLSAPFAGRP